MNELKRNELRSVKLDVRKPDGSIDLEKSRAFQAMMTEGSTNKYYGNFVSSDIKSEYENEGFFLYVDEEGMLSLSDKESYRLFKSHRYKEITFEPETRYVAKIKNTEKEDKIKELESYVKSIQEELIKLKGDS